MRGARGLHFTDVTAASGIVSNGYGMGVATGDFDNDGFVDLYLTSFGTNQLLHNNGDGTFTDVSKKSGTDVSGWSVSAAFLDYDRDGWPDLFVGSYLRYSVEETTKCFSPSGALDYCTPNTYRALPGRLFHNNRDGTFTDVTAKARIASEFGPALGVTTADFNGDGWIDIYVANDSQPNQLWINQHDGTFRNDGAARGRGADAARARRKRAWAWTPATSTTTATKICSSPNKRARATTSTSTTGRACSKTRARGRASPPPAWHSPASGRPGSTTTTTAGSIC